uniref:Uncharacterized protein n=1 Tax=Aegilops tauschii subsp. strangulata TaxID=200361 RepID=A0A453PJK1_AEGTS
MEAGVGLALQSRATGFGSGRRRSAMYGGESRARAVSLRVSDLVGSPAAVRARGAKPVVPLRAKKSSGGGRYTSSSLFPFCAACYSNLAESLTPSGPNFSAFFLCVCLLGGVEFGRK